jgi:hypothetical protein
MRYYGNLLLEFRDDTILLAIFLVLLAMWMPVFYVSLQGNFLDTWAYSELLINWSGGFVRRGLYGSLAIGFHNLTGYGVAFLTGVIFASLTFIQICIIMYLLRQYKENHYIVVLVALSPVMILFAVYDNSAYLRKETFLHTAILLHALIAYLSLRNIITIFTYRNLFIFAIAPIILINILIYEVQFFFVPFHIALTFSIYAHFHSTEKERSIPSSVPFIIFYVITILLLIASIIGHGTPDKSAQMFEAIHPWSRANNSAIAAHAWTYGQNLRNIKEIFDNNLTILTYLIYFLLGPAMIVISMNSVANTGKLNGFWLIPIILPIALFFIGWDWGRWINMIAIHSGAYMLHFPKRKKEDSSIKLSSSNYQWPLSFLMVSFVTIYILGWSLPACCAAPNLLAGPTFLTVWFDNFRRLAEFFGKFV